MHAKHSKEINDKAIIELKDDHKNEIKDIERRLQEKMQIEIDKVTIKYEKLLLESAAKGAVKDSKKSK